MQTEVITNTGSSTSVACDALLVGATTADGSFELSEAARGIDSAFEGYLSEQLEAAGFKGKSGDFFLLPSFGRISANAVAVVGLGKASAPTHRGAAGTAARKLHKYPVVASALHEDADAGSLRSSVEGLLLGSYSFPGYKSSSPSAELHRYIVLTEDDDSVERARAHADAAWLARDLVNEPASVLTPDAFGARAQQVAEGAGIECTVWDEVELERRGFGGLIGVGQGSANPPRLIQLRYSPKGSRGRVVLVGKGVCFDSGGLSLKPAQSMEDMKTDMGGGAAVLGAMSVLGRLKVGIEVNAIIPAVENMPSGTAIRPGDVIHHYGGRTTEVTNTDAEGRLILADALALASEGKPEVIVDAATLTGGIVVALGHRSTGLFSNDDALAAEVLSASEAAGERMWRMPIYDDYRSNLESQVADLKNSGPRWGAAINAAVFLSDYVTEGIPWAHLDIAGTGRADSDRDEIPRGGTGVGARTMLRWLEARST